VRGIHRTRDNLSSDEDEEGEWVEAGELRVGDKVRLASGNWTSIVNVERQAGGATVYNFEVADNHNYFVGRNAFLVHNQCDDFLVRFGKGPETLEELAEQAAKAEANGFPHGVSTMQKSRISGSDKAHRYAPKSEVEKAFNVMQTGANPRHHTVILPKPLTQDATDLFNTVFKPKN
jgi:hypothetical protein